MQYTARLASFLVFTSFLANPLYAQHGGGGGHSSGGHSSGGHSSGGFSGHSAGHAIGHSFSRIFGHHSGGVKGNGARSGFTTGKGEEPPVAGAALMKGKVTQLAGPTFTRVPMRPRFPRQPFERFRFRHRFGVFPFENGFGSCPGFGFPRRHFFLNDDFGCFSTGFFFDPFFLGSFSEHFGFDAGFAERGDSRMLMENTLPSRRARADEESGPAPVPAHSENTNDRTPQAEGLPAAADERPLTLLVLLEGSMYGLTDYWLEGHRLGYVTSYGAENSVPIESIDFVKTFQANQERGIQFAPRLKSASQ